MKYIALILLSFISFQAQAYLFQETFSQDYIITFNENDPLKAHVKANLAIIDDTLRMHSYGAWAEKEGWATFISNLSCTTENNKPLVIEKVSRLQWVVKGKHNGNVKLEYDVKFPYAQPEYEWSSVIRSTAGFYDGKGLFLLARTLFIYNSPDKATKVKFQLPEGWSATVPWQKSPDNTYSSSSLEHLMDNAIVIGKHEEYSFTNGNFDTKLVLLGYEKNAAPIMQPVFEKIMASNLEFFNYNEKSQFLMVWFPDGNWQTGEGYHDSYVVITPNVPDETDRIVWANSIAHETFHYWNGHRLASAEYEATQWFSEGFTDYKANLNLVRNGIMTEREFMNMMQKHFMLYINFRFKWGTPYKRLSLVEVGSEKSTYNAAVYDGGWTASFCLDVLIRNATQNKIGLEDVFLYLYNKYQKDKKGYTNQSLLTACNEMTDSDFTTFFNDYIFGKNMIPIEEFMNLAGFEGSTTIYGTHVFLNNQANKLQSNIRSSILKSEH